MTCFIKSSPKNLLSGNRKREAFLVLLPLVFLLFFHWFFVFVFVSVIKEKLMGLSSKTGVMYFCKGNSSNGHYGLVI